MDYTNFVKVAEETDPERVNKYLETGRWKILTVCPGQYSNGPAYAIYTLGWLGAEDENDTSEQPVPDIDPFDGIDIWT